MSAHGSAFARFVTIGLLAAAVVGCGHGASSPGAATGNPLAKALADARSAGVDQSQIDILSRPRVTYADYEAAMNRFFNCTHGTGHPASVGGTHAENGVIVIDYQLPDDPADDVCYKKYARYVDAYWQAGSPESLAFNARREKALGPKLRQCLVSHSVDVPADASFHDMILLASRMANNAPLDDNCMNTIGYSTWHG